MQALFIFIKKQQPHSVNLKSFIVHKIPDLAELFQNVVDCVISNCYFKIINHREEVPSHVCSHFSILFQGKLCKTGITKTM